MAQRKMTDLWGPSPMKKRKLNDEDSTSSKIAKLTEIQKQALSALAATDPTIFNQYVLKLEFKKEEIEEVRNTILCQSDSLLAAKPTSTEKLIREQNAPKTWNSALRKLWGKNIRKDKDTAATEQLLDKRRDLDALATELPRGVGSNVCGSELLLRNGYYRDLNKVLKYLKNPDMQHIESMNESIYVFMDQLKKAKDANKSKKIDATLIAVEKSKSLSLCGLIEIDMLINKIKHHIINELKICIERNNKIYPKITSIQDKEGKTITTPIAPRIWKIYETLLLDATDCKKRLETIRGKVCDIEYDKLLHGLRSKKSAAQRIETALDRRDRRKKKKKDSRKANKMNNEDNDT